MEIIHEWPGETLEGLSEFRNWCLNEQELVPKSEERTAFQSKFVTSAKKIDFPHLFPDQKVYDCYIHPEVDETQTHFEWGQIDLDLVRDFLDDRIGWDRKKVDFVLLPVIKEIGKRKNEGRVVQRTIDDYFPIENKQQHKNKRIRNVLDNWGQKVKNKANLKKRK